MYVESSGSISYSGIQSGIAIANLSTSPASVRVELFGLDGSSNLVLRPTLISLPGSGQTSKLLGELFSLPGPFKGVLRITASAPGISIVGLRARYNERNDFLITTTPPSLETTAATSTSMLFPHLADGGGYTTQFILFSGSSGQTSAGTLSVYDPNGQSLNLGLR
jgi:hypothetical protein